MILPCDRHSCRLSARSRMLLPPCDSAQHCDVISFENEFVDLAGPSAPWLKQGVIFRPQLLEALAPLLDKYDQRQCLQAAGLPNPRFVTLSPGQNLPMSKQQRPRWAGPW
jgi:phosphoribosylaminoimidazole carboxylase (NCAIR synthetase)